MPHAIHDDPDGSLEMLRDSARSFASRRPGPATVREKRDAGKEVEAATWSAMAEAGWTALMLSEEAGGLGLGIREQAVLSEALGAALVSAPLATAGVMSGVLLSGVPSTAERDRLASALASGALVATAWQDGPEPLRAPRGADGVRLSGGKGFVDGAGSAQDLLVIVGDGREALLLSVPSSSAGLRIVERPTVDGATVASVTFADVAVGSEKVMAFGADVGRLRDEAIACARVAIAAELAGIASSAVARTIAYTKDRVQFGRAIATFQAIQHRLVDMWTDAEFACASVVRAVDAFDAPDAHARRLAVYAAKARCGDAAVSVCRRAVHLHGAMGFTDEHDIGLFLKRAVALNATLGQAEAMRLAFVDLERAA